MYSVYFYCYFSIFLKIIYGYNSWTFVFIGRRQRFYYYFFFMKPNVTYSSAESLRDSRTREATLCRSTRYSTLTSWPSGEFTRSAGRFRICSKSLDCFTGPQEVRHIFLTLSTLLTNKSKNIKFYMLHIFLFMTESLYFWILVLFILQVKKRFCNAK